MKKRILSLILAMSMVLSVFPLGAFAADPPPELVMGANGLPDCSNGTSGNGWSYDNNTQTLTLTSHSGTYDFSSTHPQGKTPGTSTTTPVACAIVISSGVEITGGTFAGSVTNWSTISGGTFQNTCSVKNNGTIKDNGIFEGKVTNYTSGTILDGTFRGEVDNSGAIEKGTFEGSVQNNNRISGGTFQNGCSVTNLSTISGGTFQNTCSVTNHGYIKDGTFAGEVTNNDGTIYGGIFAGSVENKWKIYGGVFNGKTGLDGVTDLHSITVASGAKIEKVNGVSADWNPYVVVTQWTTATAKEVTITADTEIFSLNGQPIGTGNCNSSYGVDKKTVTFTIPNENVVLNKAITCTNLVMENGWPQASKDGQISCSGTDWSYDKNTKTLTLTSGTFDFSTTQPVQCEIEIQSSRAEITGGTFAGSVTNKGTIKNGSFEQEVTNNAGGEISGGTFYGTVTNSGYIKDGTFNGKVTNRNTIENGTFAGSVTNEGTIKNGSFEKKVTNSNTIMDGVFKGVVENGGNGTIFGGTFAGSVNNSYGGHIFGGVFNGHINVPGFGVYPITVDTASSKAEIKEVNGVSAVWEPYVVVTELTKNQKVIITASTKIYSLNHKPLSTDNCNSAHDGNENTVKFTMPNANVVLNGAITSTDLVMENGWPKDSDGGKNPCKGDGWEYIKNDPTNGNMLLLTDGLFDFSTIGDGVAVDCNVFVGKPTAITGGEFNGKVFNNSGILDGTFHGEVDNRAPGIIKGGTFNGAVENNGTIEKGTFKNMCSVTNNAGGTISDGTFAGSVTNSGTVTGGVFNGNATLINVTGGHNITWDAASSKAKIEKVNGVSADWAPYVVTSNATTKEVTITADTEIFSLNGQPIAESSYGSDKKTVTFTMPDDDVVLNKAITSTDLVMEKGWPKDSNGGKNPCKGDGWEYIPNDPTNGNMLLLTGSSQTGGLFDFSTIGDGAAVECNVFVGKPTAITGGEFNGKVFNNSGILDGTFHGEVDNRAPGIIKGGTFNGAVENNGTIEKGTFKNMCSVTNNAGGTISDGTFAGSVTNSGTVTGGVFNGNATLINVTGGHNITWDAASSKAKIEKVNGVSADWAPYVVTSNATTKEVTITADTEIFSLNGQPIGAGNCNSSYGVDKKTVTFTMPDDDVVLNGELITKPEPEPKPEPKPEPEPEPEPTTYTVTVIGGTIDGKTSVSAKENDTLTVVLDQSEIPDGMTFDMWSISSSKLSGDINVDYRAEAMPFKMPAEDVTIRAQYRSAEIIEDAAPSPLATAATIAVGGAAAGIVVWQGVNLGVDLYLANALPQGVPVPTDRRALALLLWETAGKPEVALPTLYGDIPAEEIELQKATRWAVQNGLMDAADKKDASFFDPDHYVTKMDVFGAWLRLKKLLGTIGTSPTQ